MPGKVVVITGHYQLGNNPGIFQDALYVGRMLVFPVTVIYVDTTAPEVKLFIETHDIETWSAWMGHQVTLNGTEIGRLKDPDDTFGRLEIFELTIPMATYLNLINYMPNQPAKAELAIILETQTASPTLADDFVLLRIDTNESTAIRMGW